jgi:ABC-type phosphate transport system substrate-binding protein
MKRTILLLAGLVLFGGRAARAQGYTVVVNASNPVASLSKSQAADLFMKRTGKWPGGRPAVPVDQAKNAPVRAAFSQAVLGRPVTQISAHWQQQIFSGADVPPTERTGDAAVLAFVASTPGGIGYVAAGTAPIAGVKALTVTP